MCATPGAGSIVGSWTHSHEEDAEGTMVFRPSGTQFPRARGGRESLELEPEGELCHRTSGPDDRRVETPGKWSLEGDVLVLDKEGGPERYRVDHLDEQQLVLRRLG